MARSSLLLETITLRVLLTRVMLRFGMNRKKCLRSLMATFPWVPCAD